MPQTTDWPFDVDADRNDPLTAHRIAATCSHPRWAYLVAFDTASEARPTEAETAMLASYLDEYKTHWYNDSYRAKLEQRPLDVDGGANGVIFHKYGTDDWGYRRRSFDRGYMFTIIPPALRASAREGEDVRAFSLLELMDRIHTIASDEPMPRWIDWKAAHPEVFA